ncbi:unnamed protein product [Peronospora destructor]|uniref:RxLR effector protein n=1 Tax=Peronospora destructor TaxID=86335 RepID=A0AAV0U1J4_9STRA|nr:unnamed protein product [Peronospora destructor]
MSSAARISCVLVAVVLAICSATTMATPESTSAGVALNTLQSSHAPAAIKRRLMRTKVMAMTDHGTSEERASPFRYSKLSPSYSSSKSIPAAINQKFQLWWWQLTRKSSDEVFELLKLDELAKLDTDGTKLSGDPRFMKWVTFVNARHPKDSEAANEAMLKTLADHYGEGLALGRLLVAGTKIKGMESIADDLLWLQLTRWKDAGKKVRAFFTLSRLDKEGGKTVDEFFTLLRLEKVGFELFDSPWFLQWLQIVKLRSKEAAKVDEAILSTLDRHYKSDFLLYHILRTGLMVDNKEVSNIASKLLKMRFHHELTTGNS